MPTVLNTANTQSNISANIYTNGSNLVTAAMVASVLQNISVSYINRITDLPLLGLKAFSATTAYLVGDCCVYSGQVYQCTTAHTGAWSAGDFTVIGGGGTGTVTSVSAGTGMNFTTITGSGAVAIDTTKVPYYSSGFSASGLARWNGSNWLIDTTSYQPSISLTTTGSSGAASFGSSILNIPNYTLAGLGGIGLSSLSASSPLSYNNSTGAFSIPAATSSVNGYLSSADWTTFSNKQNAITLTTTGSSGASTFSGSTLNIPNYTIDGILPSQTGNSGKYLTTNGTSASWGSVSVSAAGSNQQLQVNVSGALGAYSNLTTDGTTLFQSNAFGATYNNANCAAVFGSTSGTTSGCIRVGVQGYVSSGYSGSGNQGLQFMSTNGTYWFFNNTFGGGGSKQTFNLDGSAATSGNGANLTGVATIQTYNLASGIDGGASSSGSSFYLRFRTLNSGTQTERLTIDNGATANVNIINSTLNVGGSTSVTPSSTLQISGSAGFKYVAKTANYTLTSSDYLVDCTANTFTVTLPTAVGITGRIYEVVNSGGGTITIAATSPQTFTNVATTPTTLTLATMAAYSIRVMSNGANWIQLN